jgi:hypothetical protein
VVIAAAIVLVAVDAKVATVARAINKQILVK